MGLSYYLGADVSLRVAKPFRLFMEPYYRHPLSSSSEVRSPLRGFGVGGLSLGIRGRF